MRDRYDVKPTAIRFLGVSLGALEGAYLSVIDANEGKIGIANYLLINPPVDLHYALKKIDEWSGLAKNSGRRDLANSFRKRLPSSIPSPMKHPTIPRSSTDWQRSSPASRPKSQYLIAETLQSQLYELIYVTQVIQDQNVLPAPKDDRRKRLQEAKVSRLSIITGRSLCPYGESS